MSEFRYASPGYSYVPDFTGVKVAYMKKTPAKKKPARRPKPQYAPPAGWRCVFRVHTEIAAVKKSTPEYGIGDFGAVVRKTFLAIWKDYTKELKGKQPKELCVAVNPKWLKAALASEEMAGQQVQTNAGVMVYGLRVRQDVALPVDDLAVEEKE